MGRAARCGEGAPDRDDAREEMDDQNQRMAGANERARRQIDTGVRNGLLLWIGLLVLVVVIVGIAILVLHS
jgi:hypothetical protein